jgi:ribonuclease BN (tRNA processing enzyme)
VVLLTHLHGDHCAGVPFMLMDAMLGAKRTRPLSIAGPKDTRSRLHEIAEALFPGMHVMKPKFPLEYLELEVGQPNKVLDLVVTPQPARHTWQTNPLALRVEVGGKIVSYTGDGEFTEEMAKIGKDADLLIADLNYYTIAERKAEFGARRIILTHMSEEMLAHADEVPEEAAYDGLVVHI